MTERATEYARSRADLLYHTPHYNEAAQNCAEIYLYAHRVNQGKMGQKEMDPVPKSISGKYGQQLRSYFYRPKMQIGEKEKRENFFNEALLPTLLRNYDELKNGKSYLSQGVINRGAVSWQAW